MEYSTNLEKGRLCALYSLDGKRINSVIRRIGQQNPRLARLLTAFTDNYNYPAIQVLLNDVELQNESSEHRH